MRIDRLSVDRISFVELTYANCFLFCGVFPALIAKGSAIDPSQFFFVRPDTPGRCRLDLNTPDVVKRGRESSLKTLLEQHWPELT